MAETIKIDKLTIGNNLSAKIMQSRDILMDGKSLSALLNSLPKTWVKSVDSVGPDASGDIKVLEMIAAEIQRRIELKDYVTSWEVNMTDAPILSGTTDSQTGLKYKVDVPACMIESFNLNLRDQDISKGRVTTDDYIDWGDGSVTTLSNITMDNLSLENDIIRFTWYTDGDDRMCMLAAHKYTTPGKYVISVVGKNVDCVNHCVDNDDIEVKENSMTYGLAKNVYDDLKVTLIGDQISGTLSGVEDSIEFGDGEIVQISAFNPLQPSGYLKEAKFTKTTSSYDLVFGRTYATDGKKTVKLITNKENHKLEKGYTKSADPNWGWQLTVDGVNYTSMRSPKWLTLVSLNNTSNICTISRAMRIYNAVGEGSLKLLRVCPPRGYAVNPTDKVRNAYCHMWFQAGFQYTENLQIIKNMDQLFDNVDDTFHFAWLFHTNGGKTQNNLIESDMRLPSRCKQNALACYCYCKNLQVDILDILPRNGFYPGVVIDMAQMFWDCEKMYCSSYEKLGKLLWDNTKGVTFKNTKSAFKNCYALDFTKIPTSWGGTM